MCSLFIFLKSETRKIVMYASEQPELAKFVEFNQHRITIAIFLIHARSNDRTSYYCIHTHAQKRH